MAAADAAHKAMPMLAKITISMGTTPGVAMHIPTIAVTTISQTTFGLHSSMLVKPLMLLGWSGSQKPKYFGPLVTMGLAAVDVSRSRQMSISIITSELAAFKVQRINKPPIV